MKKTKQWAMWALPNGVFAALAWFAVVEGIGWAYNLIAFALPVSVVLLLLASAAYRVPEARAKVKVYERDVPPWLDVLYDVAMTSLFAATGHFMLAFLHLVLLFGCIDLREQWAKILAERAKAAT